MSIRGQSAKKNMLIETDFYRILNSILRFSALPAAVEFDATG